MRNIRKEENKKNNLTTLTFLYEEKHLYILNVT